MKLNAKHELPQVQTPMARPGKPMDEHHLVLVPEEAAAHGEGGGQGAQAGSVSGEVQGKRKPRPKKCVVCKVEFRPRSTTARVCGMACAIIFTNQDKERKARKELKIAKQKAKRRQDYLREAQHAFNAYIRERDKLEPCISCGRHHQGQYHAGHYRASGAYASLRFNEDNVHKQCQPCNTMKSGNLVEYRISLIRKIGLDRVEVLEGPQQPAKWTIEQLVEIRAVYKKKLKEMTA